MTLNPCRLLVKELKRFASGTILAPIYRIIYTARMIDAVYVLHAFQKKIQATSKQDIELAKKRYLEIVRGKKK